MRLSCAVPVFPTWTFQRNQRFASAQLRRCRAADEVSQRLLAQVRQKPTLWRGSVEDEFVVLLSGLEAASNRLQSRFRSHKHRSY